MDERYLAHKPKHLSFAEAAAAPLVTITAWEAQRERARVAKGQFVLVQAGAGGVGHMAVQIARLAGARVATTVTAGPEDRAGVVARCRALHRLPKRGRRRAPAFVDGNGRGRRRP